MCPRCGRSVERLVAGLCPECFAETRGVARLPRVRVEVCRYCGSVRVGGRWVPAGSFEAAVEAALRWALSRAKPVEPLLRPRLAAVAYETKPDWTTRVAVTLEAQAPGGAVVRGVERVTVTLVPSICPTCKVRVSGEWDTMIQLRGLEPGELERLAEEAVAGSGVEWDTVDLIRHRDGVDVYFTHRGAAGRVLRYLRRRGLIESIARTAERVGSTSTGRVRVRHVIVARLRPGGARKA